MKMVIADRAAVIVDQVYGISSIAVGAAKILGIELMANFRAPFFSTNTAQIWRRWHISLSSWFRDYLYIPLGGSRCSKPRKYFNNLVTFAVSGLWHGASWNYVIWGVLQSIFIILVMVIVFGMYGEGYDATQFIYFQF